MPANSQKPQAAPSLDGYFVIVGLTGGIAAYKVAQTVSNLVKLGGQVQVVTTRSGKKFVGPATFQALTGREVLSSLWHRQSIHALHVELAGGADLILVAPATANIIGKTANGIADDLLSCLIIAADCPVVFAPAMNDRMWLNPIVQDNVKYLKDKGYQFIGPAEGRLVCGDQGIGRLVEPEQIVQQACGILTGKEPKRLLTGQR